MKIAISCHPTQGGSGIVATELGMGLARRGHEVHLVSVDRPFRLDEEENSGVTFHRVNLTNYPLFRYPPHDLCLANKLSEVIVEHGIEVVHAHYAIPHAISAIIGAEAVRPHPVKVAATLHGTDITLVGSHRDFYRVTRYAMCKCDGLSAVSEWLGERTMDQFKLPRRPEVIPNFVDCGRFHDERRSPYPEDGPVRLLHVSNFRPVKRVCDVVRVFARVRERMDARLTMVGEGPERGLAEELVGEMGLWDQVRFVEPRISMGDLYREHHLFLLLSDHESFGLSALEAMACGTPVVVSRAGGLMEVVAEGQTGHLRAVGDIEGSADAACSVLEDPDRWRRMSRAAARRASRYFCTQRVLPRYEAFYERVKQGAEQNGMLKQPSALS